MRGLRKIEQAVLKRQTAKVSGDPATDGSGVTMTATAGPVDPPPPVTDSSDAVVLDYCAAVRGTLNDDQGGAA